MDRRDFIKNLSGLFGGGFGLALLGATALPPPDEDSAAGVFLPLYCDYVAGFQYHHGMRWQARPTADAPGPAPGATGHRVLAPEPGTALQLLPEFDNPHDENAIALYYARQRIGYVWRKDNSVLAQLLRGNFPLQARVVHYRPEAPTWRRLKYEIGTRVPREQLQQLLAAPAYSPEGKLPENTAPTS